MMQQADLILNRQKDEMKQLITSDERRASNQNSIIDQVLKGQKAKLQLNRKKQGKKEKMRSQREQLKRLRLMKRIKEAKRQQISTPRQVSNWS